MNLKTTVRINADIHLFDTMKEAMRFVRFWLMNPDHQADFVSIK